jgi:hypothetical protein
LEWRKKPVVIQAIQFTALTKFVARFVGRSIDANVNGTAVIHTLEGDMTVSVDDWIIRGVQGEFYPCKPDIFEATYERVLDGEPDNDLEIRLTEFIQNTGDERFSKNFVREGVLAILDPDTHDKKRTLDGEPREPECPTNHSRRVFVLGKPLDGPGTERMVRHESDFCPDCGASLKGTETSNG